MQVFEYRFAVNYINAIVSEWQAVRVRNDINVRKWPNIYVEQFFVDAHRPSPY